MFFVEKTIREIVRKKLVESRLSTDVMSFAQAKRIFKYFHLSNNLLPVRKGFSVFNPRSPKTPLDAEDRTTKRISLSKSIEGASIALGGIPGSHVYAGDVKSDSSDDIEVVDLESYMSDCPWYPEGKILHPQKYGEDFNLRKWMASFKAEYGKFPNAEEWEEAFSGCVPDANKTKEVWSTKNVKLLYLGEIIGKNIRLSESAIKYLRSLTKGVRIKSDIGNIVRAIIRHSGSFRLKRSDFEFSPGLIVIRFGITNSKTGKEDYLDEVVSRIWNRLADLGFYVYDDQPQIKKMEDYWVVKFKTGKERPIKKGR